MQKKKRERQNRVMETERTTKWIFLLYTCKREEEEEEEGPEARRKEE